MLKRSEGPDLSGTTRLQISTAGVRILSPVSCLLPSVPLCLCAFVAMTQLCKTNPIPKTSKSPQNHIPPGFTPIFRPAGLEKTNPNKPNLSLAQTTTLTQFSPKPPAPRPSSVVSLPSSVFRPPSSALRPPASPPRSYLPIRQLAHYPRFRYNPPFQQAVLQRISQ